MWIRLGMGLGRKRFALGAVTGIAVLAVACGSGGSGGDSQGDEGPPTRETPGAEETVAQDSGGDRPVEVEDGDGDVPAVTDSNASEAPSSEVPSSEALPTGDAFLPLEATVTEFGDPVLRGLGAPLHFGRGWLTNFNISLVDFDEIFSGGVPRDGIPALRDPRFISVDEADSLYSANVPVVRFVVNDDVRGYPLEILTWHEVVNDIVGGVPVAVTFCPLCNTAIAFDRTLGDVTFEFGVSGVLRNSDLIMFDRETESLWQQIGGDAIVGNMVGARLKILPSSIVSWADFKGQHPDALVLSRDTGFGRPYGQNPYTGYDDVNNAPFLFRGELDGRLSAFERVVTLDLPEGAVAYPFTFLEQVRAVAEVRGGREIVVFWTPGLSSALDTRTIEEGRDVGSTGVFERSVDGQVLDFAPNPDDESTFLDAETQSVWSILGRAVSGPMAGAVLTPIVHANHFWFAWAAFQPETTVVGLS